MLPSLSASPFALPKARARALSATSPNCLQRFGTGKSDLWLRPVFHQKTHRVEAHILVCFMALALWRTLEIWMRGKKLDTCARQLLKEVATVRSMDVILPVKDRGEVRMRVVAKQDRPVAELLHRLGVILPRTPRIVENVVEKICL